ncbi:S-adenosyl-L-methionine-dependent methyltransferase [Crepidotus variabilis]|uniref:S-adenosyl-L-methionine-dependent methyltransferase n=1 Tax=Crepidotus variabilis TaxID=179855 RepID=A0A9P6EMA7_9AGAR|nr:S-adenosyl-L-methionine-dependent methyltransferase [Crepidotus variabilis]
MATFSKTSFNASVYSLSRPTYPAKLFDYIFSYHSQGSPGVTRWDRAVDLGCGTGQATMQLRRFREVVGVDPSPGMLEKARANLAVGDHSRSPTATFKFVEGSAEDLKLNVEDESVDLVVAAQACHWFDWSKVWPETRRVLRRGGTAAFWVYTEFRLTKHPALIPLITEYAQGSDPSTSVGPHFQRPGRTILERYLVDVPEPSTVLKDATLSDIDRVFFGADEGTTLPTNSRIEPILLRREMRWRDLLGYFQTWSALHTYHEKFPDDLKREEDTRFLEQDLASVSRLASSLLLFYFYLFIHEDDIRGGDISHRFWKDLRQRAAERSSNAKVGVNDKVEVEWPVALLLVRKL